MKTILTLAILAFAATTWGAASIVPAWNNYTCATGKTCTGPTINAAKQGTNSLYWGGANGVSVGLDKTGGKDTITISGPPEVRIDCTSGNQIEDVVLFNRVTVCKSDATANTVTITDSTPRTIPLDPLSVQGECAELSLAAGVWLVK